MEQDDALRVSTRDREAAVDRLQTAFIEGYLAEAELGPRIDRALAARVRGDLAGVLGDLPQVPLVVPPAPVAAVPRDVGTGAWTQVYKNALRQAGPWTVAPRNRSLVYKGALVLDLTQATLTSDRTDFLIEGYKSRIEVVVPRGVRVEVRGSAFKGGWTDATSGGAPGGPVVVLRGNLYKSTVIVREG
jgi:hypothetical protein